MLVAPATGWAAANMLSSRLFEKRLSGVNSVNSEATTSATLNTDCSAFHGVNSAAGRLERLYRGPEEPVVSCTIT